MSAELPRRIPRALAWLVKGPAGCLAFLAGAAAVVVLLLPPAGGRVVQRMVEREFAARYAGRLELSDAWIGSLYDDQRVERFVLRDPGGDEVLRGSLRAPSFAELLEDPSDDFGPVRIRVEHLRVVAGEDGRTNLERALAARGTREDSRDRPSGLRTDSPFSIELELSVARFRYTGEGGREAQLTDLSFRGTLEWGPRATRLELEGGREPEDDALDGDAFDVNLELVRPELGSERHWNASVEGRRLPTALARVLCPAIRPLAARLGARVDELAWRDFEDEVSLSCADDGARLSFRGLANEGVVSGAAGTALELALPCAGAPGRALVAALLPPLDAAECEDAGALHELRLHAFRWPLDGRWSELEGELELALAPARARLRRWPADAAAEPATVLLGPQPARLPVRAGVLDFGGFQLPLEDGWLRLDGSLDLASGARRLGVLGERGGAALGRAEFVDEGLPAPAEAPRPPELPPPPVVPEVDGG